MQEVLGLLYFVINLQDQCFEVYLNGLWSGFIGDYGKVMIFEGGYFEMFDIVGRFLFQDVFCVIVYVWKYFYQYDNFIEVVEIVCCEVGDRIDIGCM